MKRSHKLLAAGALLGSVAAVSYAVTDSFMSYALDREVPAGLEKLLSRKAAPPAMTEMRTQAEEASARLENTTHEIVEIMSHDGLKLRGHWFSVPNTRRIVIAMHGWRSNWHWDFAMIADFLFREGCSVLFVEQRSQGESEGEYMGFGMLERYDCRSWCEWVEEQFGNSLPVYLCGVSMGASTVLMASGFVLPRCVKGIVADCGYTSADAIWRHVARQNGLRAVGSDLICRRKIKVGSLDCSCPEVLRSCRLPVLFVHGTDDRLVPVEMTYENYQACASEKRLLIVPGAGHGWSYCVNREGYEAELRRFWEDHDGR